MRVPDDERKGRRLGDETKGRIADLASGWTVEGPSPPAPEPSIKRNVGDAPRRGAKTTPPPAPGSATRQALDDKIAELLEEEEEEEEEEIDEPGEPSSPPMTLSPSAPPAVRPVAPSSLPSTVRSPNPSSSPPSVRPPGPPPPPRLRTGQVPLTGKARALRDGDPLDLSTIPEADKTKENRGVVGIKLDKAGSHNHSSSLTTNAASGTIGGDTPPIFDRAAIAAGQKGAIATERVGPQGSAPTTAVIVDDSIVDDNLHDPLDEVIEPPPPGQRLSVPIDEFATAAQMRGDATFNDASGSSTRRFEHGDPTLGDDRGDATMLSSPTPDRAPAGTLRSTAALPRQRGLAGDIRYIATVVFGVRKANRELAVLAAKQATRQQSRRHHLVTLGRTATSFPDAIDDDPGHGKAPHPALGPAREQLATVEDERAQHAEHVAAADAELTRLRRERDAKAQQYLVDLAALDGELAGLAKKLEPLDKEVGGTKKRAADLRDALRRIDGKIAATEASLASAKADKLDRAEVQAELATLRADRKAIQRDEPAIAGQLDALTPRLAALEAARGEAQRKRAEIEAAEQENQRRVEEQLVAIGAKRKVVDRAAADAEALRDRILFQLGEQLYVDRPDHLIGQLAPIDEIDLELGEADRQMMELREILSSVDKLKIARGIALIVLILGAIGALIGLVLYLFV